MTKKDFGKKTGTLIKKLIDGSVIISCIIGLFLGYATVSKALADINDLKTTVYGNGSIYSSIDARLAGMQSDVNHLTTDMAEVKKKVLYDTPHTSKNR